MSVFIFLFFLAIRGFILFLTIWIFGFINIASNIHLFIYFSGNMNIWC